VVSIGLDVRTLLGLVVFLAVMALVIARPRGLNEAWPAVGGAAALLALGLLSFGDLVADFSIEGLKANYHLDRRPQPGQ